MTWGNLSPWYAVGSALRRVIRHPYTELEVYPTRGGWRWRVDRINPKTGRFRTLAGGLCPTTEAAKTASMDAVTDLG